MKTITAKVVKLNQEEEVLRFAISGRELDVFLTSDDGINGLRSVYEALLEEIIEDDVKVELAEKDPNVTAMYQYVCVEYIKLLNNDLISARREVIDKGLASHSV